MKRSKPIAPKFKDIPKMKEKIATGARPHVPTAQEERMVAALCMLGLSQDRIAVVLGISTQTLRKCYYEILSTAKDKAGAAVVRSLFDKAVGGDVQACIFWLKCQGGWRTADSQAMISERDNDSRTRHGVLLPQPLSELTRILEQNDICLETGKKRRASRAVSRAASQAASGAASGP